MKGSLRQLEQQVRRPRGKADALLRRQGQKGEVGPPMRRMRFCLKCNKIDVGVYLLMIILGEWQEP